LSMLRAEGKADRLPDGAPLHAGMAQPNQIAMRALSSRPPDPCARTRVRVAARGMAEHAKEVSQPDN